MEANENTTVLTRAEDTVTQDISVVLCEVCGSNAFKYKCPACNTRSCSLECVKKHKVTNNCTGVVDLTAYLRKNEISEIEVNRDYNFLLNVNRRLDLAKSDARRSKPMSLNYVQQRNNRRVFTNAFEDDNVSVKRGVNVKHLPKGMSRSNQNKTGFDKKKNCFNWTIEWLLVDNDISKVLRSFTSYKCNEASKLIECFPNKNFTKFIQALNNEESSEESMKFYFYLKNYTKKRNEQLISLDETHLIADILRGKTVLEFPSIYVSTQSDHKVNNDGSDTSSDSSSQSSSDSDSDSSSDSESDSNSESDIDESDAPEESSTLAPPSEPQPLQNDSLLQSAAVVEFAESGELSSQPSA